MVVATEKLDVVIILVKVESQIATALGAFHNAGEHAGLLRNGCSSAACCMQALHLFPTDTVNDRIMDIEENRPVFFRVFNAAFYLVGLGISLEVDCQTYFFVK